MRKHVATSLVPALLLVVGCRSPIAGTWRIAPDQPAGDVTVAAMTLADDGTYTAEARYGDRVQVMSGYYQFTGDKLIFDTNGKERTYGATLAGDTLTVSHEATAVKMTRLKPRK